MEESTAFLRMFMVGSKVYLYAYIYRQGGLLHLPCVVESVHRFGSSWKCAMIW
jgi:hypothetical protein